jgi:hypothetical protein
MSAKNGNLKGAELAEQLKKNMETLMNDLIKDTEKIAEIIEKWRDPFYSYSFLNICMLYSQMPSFTQVASYRRWQDKGRQVKKGQRSLRVTAPVIRKDPDTDEDKIVSYRPVAVFDISQTEGEPLKYVKNNELTKMNSEWDWEHIMKKSGNKINFRVMKPRGETDGRQIWINSELEQDSDRICTLIHEKAHIELNHVIDPTKTIQEQELEAETVSYIVSTAMNIENQKSKAYISNFWKENPEAEIEAKATELIQMGYKIYNQITATS